MRGGTYYSSNPFWSKKSNVYKDKESKLLKSLGLTKGRRGFLKKNRPPAPISDSSESEQSADEDRNQASDPVKFRPGACANCGSTLHKRRDCVERPRKVGARHSSKSLKGNEQIDKRRIRKRKNDKSKSYDAKRDNWAGYDAEHYNEKIIEHELEEDIKRQLGLEKGDDEFKDVADDNAHYLTKDDDTKEKNYHSLRQRENIPKYLLEWKLETDQKRIQQNLQAEGVTDRDTRKIRERILQLDHSLTKYSSLTILEYEDKGNYLL